MHFVKTALTATPNDEKCGDHLRATKFCFQCKLNIMERLGRSENRAVILRKFLLCSVKVDTFKSICSCTVCGKIISLSLHFVWHSMASTLPICFLHLCSRTVPKLVHPQMLLVLQAPEDTQVLEQG